MKKRHAIVFMLIFSSLFALAQAQSDSSLVYKKRVLESPEIDLLMSYYRQDGDYSAVGGGIGTEKLDDITPTIVVTIPLNADDVLTIDAGLSAYTSASSSNINPFNKSGASKGGDDDDDDEHAYSKPIRAVNPTGTPWVASSGASRSDVLSSVSVDFSHSSNDRNAIWGAHGAFSQEFDYHSIGFGGSIARLFNEKNTELSLKAQVYLDAWRPIYPTELSEFSKNGVNFLSKGYFSGVTVVDQSGAPSNQYNPDLFRVFSNKKRNSYSVSLSFSQIMSKRLQASVFADIVYQSGLLSTPYHRIYFADKPNYYVGNRSDIPQYTSPQNKGVFQLADHSERLPSSRIKIPIGLRLNYYLSETFKLRTYYRFYSDDWGILSHTASIEVPVKLSQYFTLTPVYRYYQQTAAKYFAPYEAHLSTEQYFTSDYDLSEFFSNQYGLGLSYTDVFTHRKVYRFGFKSLNFRFSHYARNDGLRANIVSLGVKFVFE